jgi:hypothetical protein
MNQGTITIKIANSPCQYVILGFRTVLTPKLIINMINTPVIPVPAYPAVNRD